MRITIQPDRTFTFALRTPPTAYLIKKAAGLTTGSAEAGRISAGTLSLKHVYEIARLKQKDAPGIEVESMARSVVASCKSMGVEVVP